MSNICFYIIIYASLELYTIQNYKKMHDDDEIKLRIFVYALYRGSFVRF